MFINFDGIKAVLGIVEFFSDINDPEPIDKGEDEINEELEYMNFELDNMITFTLTSACYDDEDEMEEDSFENGFSGGKDYEQFKPVMIFFQN